MSTRQTTSLENDYCGLTTQKCVLFAVLFMTDSNHVRLQTPNLRAFIIVRACANRRLFQQQRRQFYASSKDDCHHTYEPNSQIHMSFHGIVFCLIQKINEMMLTMQPLLGRNSKGKIAIRLSSILAHAYRDRVTDQACP